jgi:flagellar biosynthetic protein FliP
LPVVLLLAAAPALGQEVPLLTTEPNAGGGQTYSAKIELLAILTILSIVPALMMTMTAFTRIIVVLGLLRQGIGTQQTPSNQVLIGLAFFLTVFVMSPVLSRAYGEGVQPYMAEELAADEAVTRVATPFREFMLAQTRRADLMMFARLGGYEGFEDRDEIPMAVLMPAFVTSELKTAFQIGFLILIPFLIIDLVVSSVLMSMGMVMLSPLIISLPFKLMLFVLVDGWSLIVGTLARSFQGF